MNDHKYEIDKHKDEKVFNLDILNFTFFIYRYKNILLTILMLSFFLGVLYDSNRNKTYRAELYISKIPELSDYSLNYNFLNHFNLIAVDVKSLYEKFHDKISNEKIEEIIRKNLSLYKSLQYDIDQLVLTEVSKFSIINKTDESFIISYETSSLKNINYFATIFENLMINSTKNLQDSIVIEVNKFIDGKTYDKERTIKNINFNIDQELDKLKIMKENKLYELKKDLQLAEIHELENDLINNLYLNPMVDSQKNISPSQNIYKNEIKTVPNFYSGTKSIKIDIKVLETEIDNINKDNQYSYMPDSEIFKQLQLLERVTYEFQIYEDFKAAFDLTPIANYGEKFLGVSYDLNKLEITDTNIASEIIIFMFTFIGFFLCLLIILLLYIFRKFSELLVTLDK